MGAGRRGVRPRRLFFSLLATLVATGDVAAAGLGGSVTVPTLSVDTTPPTLQIERRQVALLRESADEFRVLESLDLAWTPAPVDSIPQRSLAVLRLPPAARAFTPAGGDVASERVAYEAPYVKLSPPPHSDSFTVVLTYRLPVDVPAVALTSPLPVQELTVSVSRAGVNVRPGPGLTRRGVDGPDLARYRGYAAHGLAADSVVALYPVDDRVDPRARVAVLALVLLLGGLALGWIWRSGRPHA